jgi:hypothetical protein
MRSIARNVLMNVSARLVMHFGIGKSILEAHIEMPYVCILDILIDKQHH